MSFKYNIVLSPWAQEVLYRRALEAGEPNVKKYLLVLWLDAVENPVVVGRALAIAERQAEQVHGKQGQGRSVRTRARAKTQRVRRH